MGFQRRSAEVRENAETGYQLAAWLSPRNLEVEQLLMKASRGHHSHGPKSKIPVIETKAWATYVAQMKAEGVEIVFGVPQPDKRGPKPR